MAVQMTESVDERTLKTVFDPSTLVRKGLCPVTHIRGQDGDPLESHSLYFEQHGTGKERLLFIMGYVSLVLVLSGKFYVESS